MLAFASYVNYEAYSRYGKWYNNFLCLSCLLMAAVILIFLFRQ